MTEILLDSKNNKKKYEMKADLKDVFIGVFLLIILILFLSLCINFSFVINSLFFIGCRDIFMDYFNIADNVYTLNPYNQYSGSFPANYPAIAYLLILPFSFIGMSDFKQFSSYSSRYQDMAVFSFILYILIALVAIIYLINKYLNFGKKNILIIVLLIFSYPVLFTIERANLIIYSFIFLLIYLNFYKSDKRFFKEIAIISLALAAGLKFYNAVFIILLFKQGKILPCLRFAVYLIIVLFLPFLIFNGGFNNIPLFITNFSKALADTHLNYEYSFLGHNFSANALAVLMGLTNNYTDINVTVFCYVLIIISSLSSLFFKEEWKTLLVITCALTIFPIISYGYVTILFLLPLISLLKENKKSAVNIISLLLLIIIISPVQTGYLTNFYTLPSRTNLISGITIIITCLFMINLAVIKSVETFKSISLKIIITNYFISIKSEIARTFKKFN